MQCVAASKPKAGSDFAAWLYERDLTDVHNGTDHDKHGVYQIATSKRSVRYKSPLN